MFDRVGRFTTRYFVWVIIVWLAIAGVLKATAPPLRQVLTFDDTSFLSADAPSIKAAKVVAAQWQGSEFGKTAAIVLERRTGRLDPTDFDYIDRLEVWLRGPEAPPAVKTSQSARSVPDLERFLSSKDGQATIVLVQLRTPPFEPPTNAAVAAIRAHVVATRPEGLGTFITGEAGVGADEHAAIARSVDRTTFITLGLVILILLLIYRSPVAVLVPLATIGIAFVSSQGIIALLAEAGLKVSSLVENFMVVIIFGAGTDYCLFMMSRFREDVAKTRTYRATLVGTMAIVGAVIASSAGTVVVGFLAQGAAHFGMFRTTGPAMAIAVAVTLLTGLTLTPALMRAFGSQLFWPAHPGRLPAGASLGVEGAPATEPGSDDLVPAPSRGRWRRVAGPAPVAGGQAGAEEGS